MSDHEIAAALLASKTATPVQVWCPSHNHNLGNVYILPSGPRLCVRGWKARSQDFYEGRPVGDDVWAPAAMYTLDGPPDVPARCRCCGLQYIKRPEVNAALEQARATGATQEINAVRTFMLDR